MLSIGLMSGTSMDGIDAALLATDGEDELRALGNIQLKYDLETKWLLKALERATKAAHGHLLEAAGIYLNSLQDYLRQELQINPADVDDKIAELTTYLQQKLKTTAPLNWNVVVQLSTQLHADAVKKLLEATSQSAPEIDVIGYHGQTLFHHPEQKISIQIGDGKQLAQLTGITVINDFRRCDIAAGGQGAPGRRRDVPGRGGPSGLPRADQDFRWELWREGPVRQRGIRVAQHGEQTGAEGGGKRGEREEEPAATKTLSQRTCHSKNLQPRRKKNNSQQVRSALKRQKAGKYGARVKAQQAKRKHAAANPTPRDELLDVFK